VHWRNVETPAKGVCSELATRIGQLERLKQFALSLSQYSALAEPVVAANLRTDDLERILKMLADLARARCSAQNIDAIIVGN